MDIPVYLVAGFLDTGKTNFINGILEDGFAREDKTLLLCCEEGEEEYEKKALDNVTVVTVDDEDELTADFCRELEKKYRPKQVLIEYNGMWQMEKLYRDVLPANWVLYQIMTFVQAPTFELFVKNMGQLMMEKIINADMLVFNRCTPELKDALRARNLRMVNRRADIYLEDNDGNSEDYLTGNECPFDMTPELIDIPDDDYGVWYVDAMDHLDRWNGKQVRMKLIMCHSKKYPGVHCPGRFVMTCCENDIQFVGVVAKGKDLKAYKNRDWVEVTATVRKEHIEAYEGDGPVLYVDKITTCAKPAQEVVTFYVPAQKPLFREKERSDRKRPDLLLSVMPYQNRFPVFCKKNHLIFLRIAIGAYAMLPFRRATAYNTAGSTPRSKATAKACRNMSNSIMSCVPIGP